MTTSLPSPPISVSAAVAAGDGVVAGAAVDREVDKVGQPVAGGDDVVAAIGVDDEILGGADVEEERRRG